MTRKEQILNEAIDYSFVEENFLEYDDCGDVCDDRDFIQRAFEEGAKWADEHPSKQVYTKKQLREMGFPFTLNGDIVTPDELEKHYRRGIEYRKQKLIEKVCKQLEMRFDEYLVREVRKIMEE
jgi:hypothetical protein